MTYTHLQSKLIFGLFIILCGAHFSSAQPPPQPAVNPGEFEPMSGVIVAFPPPVPMELVAEISEDATVMSIVPNDSVMQWAIDAYGSGGVNLDNCTFLFSPASANLVRDNGPWFIFDGNGIQGIVDNIHNPGTVEDSLPQHIGDSLQIPVYQTNLTIAGGNWNSDGMGGAISSAQVYNQNPNHTQTQIHDLVQRYLGIDNYLVFGDCGGFGNSHITAWAKLLDPGRVMIKQYSTPVPELEEVAHYISTLKSSYGRPYEVVRLLHDYTTAYVNSVFMNNKILVPINCDNPLDSLALLTYQEALPGYEVLGFGPGWGPGNALSCRTMGITDRYMLRITHIPIFDQENFGQDFPVQAAVHAYSNMPLLTGMPQVYWKVEGGDYNILTMTHTVGDSFSASIPPQPDGTDIFYYIHAEDDSNRSENHPYIGPGNPHHFYVGPDTEPPSVETIIPETILPLSLPFTITAEVRDNRWISSVTLEYLINGVPADTLEMTLQPLSAALYDVEFNPPVAAGDQVQLRIKAVDNSTNQNTTYAPDFGYYEINIVGELLACVWNPCLLPSGQAIYDLLQSSGIQCFYTEEEPNSFNRFVSLFICLGGWPDTYHLSLDQINKIIDYIESGHRIYLEGVDCWAYSPYHDQLSEAFGIVGIYDGPILSNINPLLGVPGTFTSGMSFYSNNSHYVDRIAAAPGSDAVFVYADTAYGVAQETLNSKTIGMSVEFGSLIGNNALSTQQNLMRGILSYFRRGAGEIAGSDAIADLTLLPREYALHQPYPNPFNPSTTIAFDLPKAGQLSLVVYDVQGREVAKLVDGWQDGGRHEALFDGGDFVSGVYFVRLEAGDLTLTQKMVLMK